MLTFSQSIILMKKGPQVVHKTSSLLGDRLKNLGAVFGQKFGWERANWFAPEGVP